MVGCTAAKLNGQVAKSLEMNIADGIQCTNRPSGLDRKQRIGYLALSQLEAAAKAEKGQAILETLTASSKEVERDRFGPEARGLQLGPRHWIPERYHEARFG